MIAKYISLNTCSLYSGPGCCNDIMFSLYNWYYLRGDCKTLVENACDILWQRLRKSKQLTQPAVLNVEGRTVNLTRWGRVTHICVSKLTIGSHNGLSPARRQAIIWTSAGILLIWPLGRNTSEFKKMNLKMSSVKWQLFCLGLNVLNPHTCLQITQSIVLWTELPTFYRCYFEDDCLGWHAYFFTFVSKWRKWG